MCALRWLRANWKRVLPRGKAVLCSRGCVCAGAGCNQSHAFYYASPHKFTMNISRKKVSNPKPPEKGSFPLDHFDECSEPMRRYISCLQGSDSVSRFCREFSEEYLSCRMAKYVLQRRGVAKAVYSHDAISQRSHGERRLGPAGLFETAAGV